MTTTTGQALTTSLRSYLRIGSRTRRYRDGEDLCHRMVECIEYAALYPGYFSERWNGTFASGFSVAQGIRKHVYGYRLPGEQIATIKALSPWQFAGLLGEMVDAGVTNNGEAERFFAEMRRVAA